MQYTLRNVPKYLDRALRAQAAREGKSLNAVLLTALRRSLGIDAETPAQRDLSDIAGTWVAEPDLDRILADQRRIDPGLWQ